MNLKDLQLSLPDEPSIKDSLISTNPTKLREELEQLPYGNTLEALDQTTAKLALLNQTEIPTKLRFELLGCFSQPFEMFFNNLSNGETHNYSSTFQQSLDKLAELTTELGYGYKLALLSFSENNPFRTQKLAERVYCAMTFVALDLLISFQRHQTQSNLLWRDINQLYQYARSKKLLGYSPTFDSELPLANGIEALYLQISVIAVSDPYQLVPEQIAHTWRYLSLFSECVKVDTLEQDSAPDSGFVINLSGHQKPQSYRWFRQGAQLLSMNLKPLNDQLETHLKQLQLDANSKIPGLGETTSEFKNTLLSHFKNTWLQTSQRQEERVPARKKVELTYSLRDVHCIASHATESLTNIREKLSVLVGGQIKDESTSGACVVLQNMPEYNLETGQLILLFTNNNDSIEMPRLAIVRWNTLDQSGRQIHLGVRYIPGQIYPISIKADDKITVDTYPRNGLLLQENSEPVDSWQVIAAPGLHNENRKLCMTFLGQHNEQYIISNTLINHSKYIQHFSITILS